MTGRKKNLRSVNLMAQMKKPPEKRYSVKKVLGGIASLCFLAISLYGAYKNPDMIPDILYPVGLFASALMGMKSLSVLGGMYLSNKYGGSGNAK
jgi:hypothetical protein